MSGFKKYVSYCKSTAISAGVAASPAVIAKQTPYNGRHAVTICAGSSAVYYGDANVTSSTGVKLAAGESVTIPVESDRSDQVYVTGACVITEWF